MVKGQCFQSDKNLEKIPEEKKGKNNCFDDIIHLTMSMMNLSII